MEEEERDEREKDFPSREKDFPSSKRRFEPEEREVGILSDKGDKFSRSEVCEGEWHYCKEDVLKLLEESGYRNAISMLANCFSAIRHARILIEEDHEFLAGGIMAVLPAIVVSFGAIRRSSAIESEILSDLLSNSATVYFGEIDVKRSVATADVGTERRKGKRHGESVCLPEMIICDDRDCRPYGFALEPGHWDDRDCVVSTYPPSGWCLSEHVKILTNAEMRTVLRRTGVLVDRGDGENAEEEEGFLQGFSPGSLVLNVESSVWAVFKTLAEHLSDGGARGWALDMENVRPVRLKSAAINYHRRSELMETNWEFLESFPEDARGHLVPPERAKKVPACSSRELVEFLVEHLNRYDVDMTPEVYLGDSELEKLRAEVSSSTKEGSLSPASMMQAFLVNRNDLSTGAVSVEHF